MTAKPIAGSLSSGALLFVTGFWHLVAVWTLIYFRGFPTELNTKSSKMNAAKTATSSFWSFDESNDYILWTEVLNRCFSTLMKRGRDNRFQEFLQVTNIKLLLRTVIRWNNRPETLSSQQDCPFSERCFLANVGIYRGFSLFLLHLRQT